MPAAGSGRGLRGFVVALLRREARRVPQECRPADLDGRDDALHPLHALRPLRPGSGRRDGARDDPSRRTLRDHDRARRHDRLRAVGQHDRHLPGRRTDQQAVPLQRPYLGALAPQEREPARQRGQQPDRAGQEPPGDACRSARERRRQRMLDRGPRPLLVRSAERRRSSDQADDQAGRRVGGSRLADRARVHHTRADADCRRARSEECRRARRRAQHGRRTPFAREARARPRQRERRRAHPPCRLLEHRGRGQRTLARHADRRLERPAARARRRVVPAQNLSRCRPSAMPTFSACSASSNPTSPSNPGSTTKTPSQTAASASSRAKSSARSCFA